MALRERYVRDNGDGTAAAKLDDGTYSNQTFQEIKARLHRAIITKMDLTKMNEKDGSMEAKITLSIFFEPDAGTATASAQ